MSAPAPADRVERDRIEADLGATLFVEAAAGTGKTTALVARVVRLVATGTVRMGEVAAITFTEKAAAELRDRVRRRLTEAVAELPDDEGRRCRAALGELDDAAVCTLHAFAQRILAEFPLEAGLPPRFEILDELEATTRFDASWERFAGELLDGADDDLRTAVALGVTPADLRDLALAFRAQWERLEDASFGSPPLPALDATSVRGFLAEAVRALPSCSDPEGDLMAIHLAGLQPVLERLAEAGDDLAVLLALRDASGLELTRGGQARNWGGRAALDDVRALLAEAQAACRELFSRTGAALAARLAERIRGFTLAEAERRRREGGVEFHDLLVLGRRLLRHHEPVRTMLRARWRRLLIDEFQDTDPLQIELAVLLATPAGGTVDQSWTDLDVDAGRLFVVGDPKQSIYRFRRADIALYHRVQARFVAGRVTLQANFRCAPPIVDWANHVFERLLGAGAPGHQAAHVALRSTRASAAPSVRSLGEAWPSSMSIAEIREREAGDVAALVRRARDEGWLVHDAHDGIARAARFRDVAILLPTRRLLPELERAMAAAGVPYRIESRSLLWSTQEVRDLLATLRAVNDPADQIALVATLRSPGFACRDDELLAWKRQGGSWSYLDEPTAGADPEHPVARALDALRTLHHDRHWVPLHAMVERVIRERRMVELQSAHPRPRDHWRRLRFAADQARAFETSGGATLRGFVDWADAQAREEALVNESVVAEVDDDSVSVMTVHAAKGLEFPIVVVAGLNSYPPSRRPAALFADEGIEVEIGRVDVGVRTPAYEQRLVDERAAEEEEGVRLLYVASTRARDHLVVSLHHKEGVTRCHAHRVLAASAGADSLWQDAEGAGPAPETPPPAPLVPPRDAWAAERREVLAGATRANVTAATAVAGERDEEPPETPPWKRGRAGTAVGRAVHAVLQTVDLATGEGLEALAAAQAAAEGVPDRLGDISRAARAALGSRAVRAAVEGGRFWREVYVGVEIGGTLLEGFVDLLVERDGALAVVDYKTDRVKGDAGALADRYRLQGAAYAAALEATLDRPVTGCTFVFVGDGHPVEVDVPALSEAIEEVRSLIAAPAG